MQVINPNIFGTYFCPKNLGCHYCFQLITKEIVLESEIRLFRVLAVKCNPACVTVSYPEVDVEVHLICFCLY